MFRFLRSLAGRARRRRRAGAAFLLAAGVALAGAAAAQDRCIDQLREVVEARVGGDAGELEPAERKELAAGLLRRAVELIELALPASVPDRAESIDPEAPGGEDARWLAARGYLPGGWPEELTPEAWTRWLSAFPERYDAEVGELSGALDAESMLTDAATALQAVSEAVRPLALIATDEEAPRELEFTGLIWNWTPHPRFLLFRPGEDLDEERNPAPVLESMSTCALRPSKYLMADAETAASLYLASEQTRMRILAVQPPRRDVDLPVEVPEGEEQAYLGFERPELRGVQIASVAFEGPGPGVLQSLELLRNTRTNLNVFDFQHYLAFPP